MIEIVKFTKKQRLVLRHAFIDANDSFDKNMREKPYLYRESERSDFVRGYVSSYLDFIVNNGYGYLE